MFINTFVDQDFLDRYKIFLAGKRLSQEKRVWEYYVKSRNAQEYRQMLIDSLYHPPHISIDEKNTDDTCLYLNHRFEGKPLVREFIANTMIGIEYLWGGPVKLETTELIDSAKPSNQSVPSAPKKTSGNASTSTQEPQCQRVVYTMEKRKLTRAVL
jgi:stage V sporulation protein R